MMPQVTIKLARIGKLPRAYTEGFLSDNGIELRTLTVLSQEISAGFRAVGKRQVVSLWISSPPR